MTTTTMQSTDSLSEYHLRVERAVRLLACLPLLALLGMLLGVGVRHSGGHGVLPVLSAAVGMVVAAHVVVLWPVRRTLRPQVDTDTPETVEDVVPDAA